MCKRQYVTKYLVTWFTGTLSARVIVQCTNNREKTLDTSKIAKDHQQPCIKDHQQPCIKDHQQPLYQRPQSTLYETTINLCIKDHNQPCMKPQSTTLHQRPSTKTINNPVSKTIDKDHHQLPHQRPSPTAAPKTITNPFL